MLAWLPALVGVRQTWTFVLAVLLLGTRINCLCCSMFQTALHAREGGCCQQAEGRCRAPRRRERVDLPGVDDGVAPKTGVDAALGSEAPNDADPNAGAACRWADKSSCARRKISADPFTHTGISVQEGCAVHPHHLLLSIRGLVGRWGFGGLVTGCSKWLRAQTERVQR